MYWSGDYLCRQRRKPPFNLDQITPTFWKYAGTQASGNSRIHSISRRGWYWTVKLEFLMYHRLIRQLPHGRDLSTLALDQVTSWTKQKCTSNQIPSYAWEDAGTFRSESKMEKSSSRISTVQFLQRIWWSWWRIDWLSSSGIFTEDLLHWRSSRRSRRTCKIKTLNLESLKIESSSCQCSTTSIGQREEIQKNVFQTPNKSRLTRRDSREDTWLSSVLETKRSGAELSATPLKEMGFHRHTNGGTIQRNWSPSMQKHQCFSRGILNR